MQMDQVFFSQKYGYNLEYMLNSNDATNEQKQEKISMLKYTYEQVLSSQAEQVDTKKLYSIFMYTKK